MESNKKKILELFKKNVLGLKYEKVKNKNEHCGGEGHWLEDKMLIKHIGL